jgi:hypothetical protein
MFHPIVSLLSLKRYAALARKVGCRLIGPALVIGSLGLVACNEETPAPQTLPPIITDVTPVGDGLSVIGIAMIAAAVVLVLGKLLR